MEITKIPFERAYDGFPGSHSVLNVDAALIKIVDITRWTSQVYGIGQFEEVADLNVDAITLDLIGCPTMPRLNGCCARTRRSGRAAESV